MPGTGTSLLESKLLAAQKDSVVVVDEFRDCIRAQIKSEKIRDVISFLKSDPQLAFDMMMDLFGMDYEKFEAVPGRFAVVYNLYSTRHHHRIFLKVFVDESNPEVDSIHDIYAAANWFEREAWDLFGIVFRGHPGLMRILCHNDFVGHPLRKDYPSDGYQRLKEAADPSRF